MKTAKSVHALGWLHVNLALGCYLDAQVLPPMSLSWYSVVLTIYIAEVFRTCVMLWD